MLTEFASENLSKPPTLHLLVRGHPPRMSAPQAERFSKKQRTADKGGARGKCGWVAKNDLKQSFFFTFERFFGFLQTIYKAVSNIST